MTYPQILNCFLSIHHFFQLYVTKMWQPKNLITTYRKYVPGLISGECASTLNLFSKNKRLFSLKNTLKLTTSRLTFTCSKPITELLEKGEKYGEISQGNYQSDFNEVLLVF